MMEVTAPDHPEMGRPLRIDWTGPTLKSECSGRGCSEDLDDRLAVTHQVLTSLDRELKW
jgi:hypothetical protein